MIIILWIYYVDRKPYGNPIYKIKILLLNIKQLNSCSYRLRVYLRIKLSWLCGPFVPSCVNYHRILAYTSDFALLRYEIKVPCWVLNGCSYLLKVYLRIKLFCLYFALYFRYYFYVINFLLEVNYHRIRVYTSDFNILRNQIKVLS